MVHSLLGTMDEIVNIRHYNSDQLSDGILTDLYNAFAVGPSSISTQARELLVVESKSQREQIVGATLDPYMTKNSNGAQSWLIDAPFVGVVLIEKRRAMARVGDIGISIAKQEAEAAIQNLRLIARKHELSTACVRELDVKTLKCNLNLQWYIEPVAVISAGYSDVPIDIPPRLSLNEVIHYEACQ